jgi:hypothetical protein
MSIVIPDISEAVVSSFFDVITSNCMLNSTPDYVMQEISQIAQEGKGLCPAVKGTMSEKEAREYQEWMRFGF